LSRLQKIVEVIRLSLHYYVYQTSFEESVPKRQVQAVLQYIHKVAQPSSGDEATDRELLRLFLADRDETAFAMLVRRHGPLVLSVCGRILNNIQDTEDAFQATFLVLVSKARSIAKHESLASWLHGVARRVALRLKTKARMREKFDRQLPPRPAPDSLQEVIWRDLRVLLDEEVARLPLRYREPFVLCYMQGKTNDEAANLLRCPKGTIDSRLSRARERLRQRLVRRGLGVSAGLVAVMLSQNAVSGGVPMTLELLTIKSAVSFANGAEIGLASKHVLSLTQEIVKAMPLTKLKVATVLTVFVGLTATGAGLMTIHGQERDSNEVSKPESRQPVKEVDRRELAQAEPSKGDGFVNLQLEMAQKEFLQIISDLRKAKVELALAESRSLKAPSVSETALEEAIAKDPVVMAKRQLVQQREDALSEYKRANQPKEFEHIPTKKLDEAKKDLLERMERISDLVRRQMLANAQEEHSSKIALLAEKVEFLEALKKVLKADIDRLTVEAKTQGDNDEQPRIKQLEKEVRELKALVEELKKRK
jgi:RNA polymerase sigma factor (sigma-70 family)